MNVMSGLLIAGRRFDQLGYHSFFKKNEVYGTF